ncbi:MAG: 2,4-diaminopentanoate dehydrogenase [Bacillota bacterium]
MQSTIKVLVWGMGAMGGGICRMVMDKPGLELVAAVAATPAKAGRDVGDVLEFGYKTGVMVTNDAREAFDRSRPDVAILATKSFISETLDETITAIQAGAHVVSIAEEMADPWAQHPGLADRIHQAARGKGVTVLGTGVNPGFVLDVLIICLSGACVSVDKITARRVNDLSPFGPTVMKTQGVGTRPEEFQAGVKNGSIVGHVGFPESINLIARALGWTLDRVEQQKEPIISSVRRQTKYVTVEPGWVAGCRHTASGYAGGHELIRLEHPQQVLPELEGVATGDYISIEGTPRIDMAIKPEIPGGLGTIATAVNMVPLVVAAQPGLLTMVDLPVPRAMPGKR